VQIGVETDQGSGSATQWQTIKFGTNPSNKMIDCWGQLVFLDTTGWVNSDAVNTAQNTQFTFGGVIHGDSQLTGINKNPSGWL